MESIIEEYLQAKKQEPEIKVSINTTEEDYKTFCEQDASEVLSQVMEIKRQSICEEREKYDITTHEEFVYYEAGDVIEPYLKKALEESFAFYSSIVEEESCKKLMKQSVRRRCEWLVEQNRSLLMRDQDWYKIFTDIEENELSFFRYYPMVRIKLNHADLVYLTRALVLNDELYELCKGNVG